MTGYGVGVVFGHDPAGLVGKGVRPVWFPPQLDLEAIAGAQRNLVVFDFHAIDAKILIEAGVTIIGARVFNPQGQAVVEESFQAATIDERIFGAAIRNARTRQRRRRLELGVLPPEARINSGVAAHQRTQTRADAVGFPSLDVAGKGIYPVSARCRNARAAVIEVGFNPHKSTAAHP